jgi:antitoxin component YwqK of YwqJK toxin-antitoxin module
MNIRNFILTLVLCLLPALLFSQNITDAKGLKQGQWEVKYPDGKVKYSGTFRNGKPIGEFRRYYETGELKVVQLFDNKGNSYTKIYYDNGELAAEGKYVGEKKDSIWKYYSYYDKSLKMTEPYNLGVHEGFTQRYYSNGQISDKIEWHNNQMDGSWTQYFENGKVSLKAINVKGVSQGVFQTFYNSGQLETDGFFKNGLPEGIWTYFDEKGQQKTKIEYVAGVAKNQEQLTEKEQEYFKKMEQNKGRIPEPSEDDLMPH